MNERTDYITAEEEEKQRGEVAAFFRGRVGGGHDQSQTQYFSPQDQHHSRLCETPFEEMKQMATNRISTPYTLSNKTSSLSLLRGGIRLLYSLSDASGLSFWGRMRWNIPPNTIHIWITWKHQNRRNFTFICWPQKCQEAIFPSRNLTTKQKKGSYIKTRPLDWALFFIILRHIFKIWEQSLPTQRERFFYPMFANCVQDIRSRFFVANLP